ncbi:lanthionine synthetase LanC family protein [Chryseobacterium pennipullorum]|uniref:Lanthionine synthetase C-like protein n=1 Tax=Chryseobacterium pennipullorum TaxID=2258963 RepID=A0A3D9AV64_9FLAO|nr:lanthionine synthetase LanC family protein [Chryseobacterium pennipullorum]REC44736.1 hypothetical protein DRF67_16790 [Chryseobacterium pennipullorum]
METLQSYKIDTILEEYDQKILHYDYSSLPDGLLFGKLGLLLYFLSHYQIKKDEQYLGKVIAILEEVFENANLQKEGNVYALPVLSKGLTGLGVILDLLKKAELIEDDFDEQIADIGEILFSQSIKMLHENNYTFFDGPIGNLYYFNTVKNEQYSSGLIDLLYEECMSQPIPFENKLNDSFADGINLGFNYGYLSIVNNLLSLPVIPEKAKHIINSCIQFIISNFDIHEIENAKIYKPYNYTGTADVLKPFHNNRLCWCNSDLSFSYLLYKASEALQNDQYKMLAHEIGMETTKRRVMANTGIELVHYCHGTSGLVQLYHEVYQRDRQQPYKDSERFWTQKSLEILENELDHPFTEQDSSLIFGKTGALLALNDKIDKTNYLKFLL